MRDIASVPLRLGGAVQKIDHLFRREDPVSFPVGERFHDADFLQLGQGPVGGGEGYPQSFGHLVHRYHRGADQEIGEPVGRGVGAQFQGRYPLPPSTQERGQFLRSPDRFPACDLHAGGNETYPLGPFPPELYGPKRLVVDLLVGLQKAGEVDGRVPFGGEHEGE